MSLVHGTAITAEEVERIVGRQFTPQSFASLSNAIVWGTAGQTCAELPSFTERVNVKDQGIDGEWEIDLLAYYLQKSPLLASGWRVFQYKQCDIFTQGREKVFAQLVSGVKGAVRLLYQETGRAQTIMSFSRTSISLT